MESQVFISIVRRTNETGVFEGSGYRGLFLDFTTVFTEVETVSTKELHCGYKGLEGVVEWSYL